MTPHISGVVASALWKDLEPTRGAPLPANNYLDQSLQFALDHNLQIGIRVFTGDHSPAWCKARYNAFAFGGLSVPCWWQTGLRADWKAFIARLGAAYDGHPALRCVWVSLGAAEYPEPYLHQAAISGNVTAILKAWTAHHDSGAPDFFTDEQACLHEQIDAAAAAFTQTRFAVSHNPYQRIVGPLPGSYSRDEATTDAMMRYGRSTYGPRFVIGNNSVSQSRLPGPKNTDQAYAAMYNAMTPIGHPICFQAAQTALLGSASYTLQQSATVGASMVELRAADYLNQNADVATFDRLSALLAANAR